MYIFVCHVISYRIISYQVMSCHVYVCLSVCLHVCMYAFIYCLYFTIDMAFNPEDGNSVMWNTIYSTNRGNVEHVDAERVVEEAELEVDVIAVISVCICTRVYANFEWL